MDKEEQNFIKLFAPLKGLNPAKVPLERMIVTPQKADRYRSWWYALSPIVAVMIIFLIKSARPGELDTASDIIAMRGESEAIGRQVEIDLMAIEEDNINKLGLDLPINQ